MAQKFVNINALKQPQNSVDTINSRLNVVFDFFSITIIDSK